MKFETRKQAVDYAKLETIRTHRKHIVVNSFYWSMDEMKEIPHVTVILSKGAKPL